LRIPPNAIRLAAQANTLLNTYTTVSGHVKKANSWWEGKHTYTVSVAGKDVSLYTHVREWLNDLIPDQEQRSVALVWNARTGIYTPMHDDSATHVFELNGKRVKVELQKPSSLSEMLADDIGGGVSNNAKSKKEQILFTVYSSEDQEMLISELQEVRRRATEGPSKTYLWTLGLNGDWTTCSYLPRRPIDSVILPDGQVDRIVDDLKTFRAEEDSYDRLGIPWHRGYLFHGPPGTGKTSLAKALANHFAVDMYYMPLGSVSSDVSLMGAFSRISKGSILLLEDVDVFTAMQNRHEDKAHGKDERTFSLSGLLNVLDGVMTPSGLVTIMTTNDIAAIDDAIMRPGRVDMLEKLDNLAEGQAENIFHSFYGRYPSESLNAEGRSPAEIVNALKAHMHDPEMAERAILKTTIKEDS
jgi:chaperone BCS1